MLPSHLDELVWWWSDIRDYESFIRGGEYDIVDYLIDFYSVRGNLEIVKKLYEKFQLTNHRCTYFVHAAENGHLPIVKYFVNSGDEISKITLCSALKYAIQNGHLSVVKYLYSLCGNSPDNVKFYAFEKACARGHLSIIKFLVRKGKDIHYNANMAIQVAARYNQLKVVEYLVKKWKNNKKLC